MNIRYKLFTCQEAILLITLPFSADFLLSFFSSHKLTALTQTTRLPTSYNPNFNSNCSASHPTRNRPSDIMTSKATNSAGLTAREVDILCAMCQSLKSKPDVRLTAKALLPSLHNRHSLTPTKQDRHGEVRHPRRLHHQGQRHHQPLQGLEESHGQGLCCFARRQQESWWAQA